MQHTGLIDIAQQPGGKCVQMFKHRCATCDYVEFLPAIYPLMEHTPIKEVPSSDFEELEAGSFVGELTEVEALVVGGRSDLVGHVLTFRMKRPQ